MIAPLNVPTVIAGHCVHDDMCPRSTVINVAKNMQLIDGQTLNDIADGNNEIIGSTG